MPWQIFEEDGKFCVYKLDANKKKTGKSKGCHPMKKDAMDQMKALYANVEMHMKVHLNLEASSLTDQLTAITNAFHSMSDPNPNPMDCYIKEVYDGYLLVSDGKNVYKVGYTYDAGSGTVKFDPVDDWKEQKYVDASVAFFVFTELEQGAVSVFDGLAASHDVAFVSMSGEELFIEPEDLSEYISNGQAVIESTRTTDGEVIGLPIDLNGHDHKGGAGWIKGFELDTSRNIVRFLVEWTQEGADLIRNNIRRFFSPSVDPIEKVILGGSMTNWPATRNSKGQLLLRPIELSQSMEGITMPTIEETLAAIMARLDAVEANKPTLPKQELASPPASGEEPNELDLTELLGDDAQIDHLGKMAQVKAKEVLRVEHRKSHVVDFVSKVVGGTADNPVGLNVSARELTRLLLSLPEKQSLAVERVIAKIWDGAIDFSEHGIETGDKMFLRKAVPAAYAGMLREWVDSGHSATSFFATNPEIGEADEFNLSAYMTPVKEA